MQPGTFELLILIFIFFGLQAWWIIPIVIKNNKLNNRVKTVTPAIISRARGKSSNLVIRVSVKTINGYKAIARKGKTAQEVFISTDLSKDELKKLLDSCNHS